MKRNGTETLSLALRASDRERVGSVAFRVERIKRFTILRNGCLPSTYEIQKTQNVSVELHPTFNEVKG